ncbi:MULTISPECIES: phenylacetate--CoA ligase family protein [Aequorivita]|uniref:Phenylacetate--CoA ligase family protein n=1 Tax=Aequorivita iocasae TaxID=2803865 RepID=A0ABX7DVF0_9FLAO|nr:MULTISPECIES: phenylacetate--CoA ligase family protein [Aequorivita]QQX77591.1 phenylacetate--CoA ligase family protein [Aequorivita iocasae]UCA57086.1 phenylacetate--CoA ligase family protein [Aequorivita sp. F7]
MRLFDISLFLKRFPIKRAKEELLEISEIKEADYEAFLNSKKAEIVNYHLKNNSFYRNKVKDGFSTWESLPILKKVDYQIPLKERLSKGFSEKNSYTNKTSGSSGNPIRFAKDKYSHAITWAYHMERFGWYGINFNSSLQARYYGIPLDTVENKTVRLKDFLAKRYRFSINDLSEKALDEMLKVYKQKPFEYINGYTSSIVLFAKYLREKNIVLKNICPTLKVCIVTSEMLFEADKILLENRLGVPIVNEYGCSEAGVIAFTNPHGEWEVDSKTLFIEILDENDQPVPLGEEGRIVITSLHNKAHPFIRYEIGDYGALSEESTFKKPILKKLTGRTNDFATLPSGKKAAGMTFYVITKKIMEESGNIQEFKVIQTKIDTFEINYVSKEELTEEKKQSITETIEQFLEPGLTFNFHRKAQLDRSASGKLKQFVSLVEN